MTAHLSPDDDSVLPAAAPSPGEPDPGLRVLLVDASDRGGIARYTRCLREALQAEHTDVALAAPVGVGDRGLEIRGPRWGPDVARMSKAFSRSCLTVVMPASASKKPKWFGKSA